MTPNNDVAGGTSVVAANSSTSLTNYEKRRRVGVQVHLEANGDGAPRVHQMLGDGTYIPAIDSDFERTATAASAFVARTLAARHGTQIAESATGNVSAGAVVSDPSVPGNGDNAQWVENAHKAISAGLYEIGRIMLFIESVRGGNENVSYPPTLALKRNGKKIPTSEDKDSVKESTLRDAPATIMSIRRSLTGCSAILRERSSKLRKWIKDDNEFTEAFHYLRNKALGVRRSANGAPLIDVGDGNFAEVKRVEDSEKDAAHSDPGDSEENSQDPKAMVGVVSPANTGKKVPIRKRYIVRVKTPPITFLSIGLERLEKDCLPVAAPVVQPSVDSGLSSNDCLEVVLRRIRLARVSAFRKITFERMTREAAEMTDAIDFTNNSISVESGPYDVLRVDRTMRRVAPDLSVASDLSQPLFPNFRKLQDASLLQMVLIHQSVLQGKGIFDLALMTTSSLTLLRALEKVLDGAVSLLGVRVEWARGGLRPEEARVWVWSDAADGDGPARSLLVIEPLSTKNNAGDACTSGHVKLTPAFGVIIPAPDDPNARGRAAVLLAQSSSSSGGAPTILFDDVPRSYVCPVHSGSEIVATVTLLLCIRLLDALELAARAGEAEVLDVDRQCFLVVVSSPQSGRTLRVKVWPKAASGGEVPATTAWLNGKVVEDFPATAPGRLVAWKKLLKRLVADKSSQPAVSSTPTQNVGMQRNMINGGAGVYASATQNAHLQAAVAASRQQHAMRRNAQSHIAAQRQQMGMDSNTNGLHGLNGFL